MVIVIHFSLSVKQYAQAESCPGRDILLPERCPHPGCQASHSLIRWGSYQRWACTEAGDYRLCIQRVRCKSCGRTHSLLPDFLHPHRHYVLELLQRVVWLYLMVGLGFGQVMTKLPELGPAPATVREWVQAFAYGAGYLLRGVLSRCLLTLNPQSELPGPGPAHLERSRQPYLKPAHYCWQLIEQVYAQVKVRQPRLHFAVAQLLCFGLHWLQAQSLVPRFFWSPRLSTRVTDQPPPPDWSNDRADQQSCTLPLAAWSGYTGVNLNSGGGPYVQITQL